MSGNGSDTGARLPQEQESAVRNLMAFRVDRQTYALPIEPIVQIVEMVAITPIPQVNDAVEGVINVRGTMVPVVNLRRHLGLPEACLQLHTPLILAQTGDRIVGLIVDEVIDVLDLPAGQITRPTDILPHGLGEAPLLQGLAHTSNGLVLVLDLDRLFSPDRVGAWAEVVAGLPAAVPPTEGDGSESASHERDEHAVETTQTGEPALEVGS